MKDGTTFFANRACRYFPCHRGIPEEDFNCLFCYCPLYMLGRDCGGDYQYLENGIKSCMNCSRPHDPARYGEITDRLRLVIEKVRESR
ncbi:MAG: cysteine-rich small domain-containing protein [Lachnospiraceae bacterium]|jgi:Zn-finger protein